MSLAEYAVLARRLGANDAAGALTSLKAVVADPALVERARRHQLISLLWATIPEDALRTVLPAEAFATFDEWLRRPRPSPSQSLRTFAEAEGAFRADGIDCMLLKGAYFGDRLYGGLDRRAQYDVDLLVHRRDFSAAARTLRALGYVERWQDLHSATWKRGGAHIDLHSHFRNAPAYRLDEGRIWHDRVGYSVAGVRFTTPSDGDTLVLLALSLFQDVGLGAAKLRQVLDVCLLAESIDARFDWAGFFARCEPEGTRGIVANVLDLVVRVFDAATSLPRLSATLAHQHHLLAVSDRGQALALLFAERSALANRAWFFRVYPGSVARYWIWLLPRKIPSYLRGKAPARAASSMRPSLATVRLLFTRSHGMRQPSRER